MNQETKASPPSSVSPPAACSTEYREGYEQAKKESAAQIESLRQALIYIDRQVREVWPEQGSTYQNCHRLWAIDVADKALKEMPAPLPTDKPVSPISTQPPPQASSRLYRYSVAQQNPVVFHADADGPWCLHDEAAKYVAELEAARDRFKAYSGELDRKHFDASAQLDEARAELARVNANPVDDSMRQCADAWHAVYAAICNHARPERDECLHLPTGMKIAVAVIEKLAGYRECKTALALARSRIEQLTEERNAALNDVRLGDGAYAMANQNIANLKGSLAEADKRIGQLRSQETNDATSMLKAGTAVGHIVSILQTKDTDGVDIELGSTAFKSLMRWAKEASAVLLTVEKMGSGDHVVSPKAHYVGIDKAAPGSDMTVEATLRQGADGKLKLMGWRVVEPSKPTVPEPVKWRPEVGDDVVDRRDGHWGKVLWFTPNGRAVVDFGHCCVGVALKDLMPKP